MTGSRSSILPAALVAASLAAGAPAAAQETAPLDIVPLPAIELVDPAAEIAPEVLETPDAPAADEAPDTPPRAETEVEIGEIQAPDPEATGLIEEADGGFAFDMWRGSDRALVERLLPRLPAGATSRAMNGLARRLLLSSAAPPEGPAGASLLALRIVRLAAMGEGGAMNHLMRAAPPGLDDAMLSQTRVDALLLTADFVSACAQARDMVRRNDAPYWEKVLIFCLALNNQHDAAALGVELLRERGVDDDAAFIALLGALAGDPYVSLDSMPNPMALHLAMLRAARLSVPDDAIRGAEPAIARAIALTASVPLDLRLRAAERAEALGALPTETLAEFYASVPFTPEELANPWRRIKTDKGAMARALLFQAIAIQVVPAARAEVLRAAWLLGREAGGWDGFATAARVTLDHLLGLRPLPELVWIAGDAVRALLAAGRPDKVSEWLDLAAAQAGANADAAAMVAALGPVAGLASATAAPWDNTQFAIWWESQGEAPEAVSRARAELLLGLLTALDREAPTEALLLLLDGPPTVWIKTPPSALLRQLDIASGAGRVGETVLLALIALDSSESGAPGPMTVSAVVAALYRVGLADDARALAVEAVLSREF